MDAQASRPQRRRMQQQHSGLRLRQRRPGGLLANCPEIFKTDDSFLLHRQRDCPVLEPQEWPYQSHFDGYLDLPDPLEVSEGHLRVFRWLSTEYEWTTSESYPDPDRWTEKIAMHAAECKNFEMIEILNKHKHQRLERDRFISHVCGD